MSYELKVDFGIIDFENDNDRGVDLLPYFLKNSTNINNLIKCILPEIQELHDAQSDVYSTVNINEAVGLQLDDIFGNILDTEREDGQSDDDYRVDLLLAITKFARSGEISILKSIFKSIMEANFVRLYEYQPHMFKLEANVDSLTTQIPFTLAASVAESDPIYGLTDGSGTGGYLVSGDIELGEEIEARLAKAREAMEEAKQGGVKMQLSVNTESAFTLVSSNPQTYSDTGLTDGTFDGGYLSIEF